MKSQICVRIDSDIDDILRAACSAKGDLSAHINTALREYAEKLPDRSPVVPLFQAMGLTNSYNDIH